ncbi:hypothetical protein EST38_g5354 [Candolleomyces aberdarensis]|uniref:F-box domain-containing protein n=1 Tax=Candolleomyces aberdarensis TaxID=2316362 RepID=A0A4Q2DMQ9_9AGAR|nr:hypothetical protein EST38_g5354 [Candolleomyces aberdarensis]
MTMSDFWCTDELALHTFASLPAPDLRNCAQVSRSFNRTAVQSVLDQHKIWNPEQSAVLQLADNPNDLDGLSALLLSVHIKSLPSVLFSLERVTALQSALKAFHKMQRLVDRMASLHSVYVNWPSNAYQNQPISDKMLAAACKCVEEFLDTIISKGCATLQFNGFDAFASKYKLKKNPAITAAEIAKAPTAERLSIWEGARGYLPSLHTRATSDVLSPLSEEGNYSRKPSRFSISTPWISLTPSPKLSQVTKLTTFYAGSTGVFRPPFSQWTFALLKASAVTCITLSLQDIPDGGVESKLILDRLAEATPDVNAIRLHSARPGLMKDVVTWLGRFQQLGYLHIDPACFSAGNNVDDLELQALARLPHIYRLSSSSYFLCAYLASCRSVDGESLPRALEVIMRHMWMSSTESAVSAFIKDVERLHNAILEAPLQCLYLCIFSSFDCFPDRAKALGRLWSRLDSGMLRPVSDAREVSLEALPCFRATRKHEHGLILVLRITVTEDEIQRGVVDGEVVAFCRMFPTLEEILFCSDNLFGPGLPLRKEGFDKLKSVCPKLRRARLFMNV